MTARVRLGLVAAPSGAEALTAVGWAGPCNYENDTAKVSAVVRDWEDRFEARVVAVGFSTLHLSVADPTPPPERNSKRSVGEVTVDPSQPGVVGLDLAVGVGCGHAAWRARDGGELGTDVWVVAAGAMLMVVDRPRIGREGRTFPSDRLLVIE
ncbi:hypothetical protein J2X68_007437 [Streptomyces sp. 3330]|uniref:DUF4253 domain-containing protein n=1 Tax=Streptomyces sp. 3330 TaxID=2817755 RepID=UPI00285F9740|nr:DUF4253 domain-containing protein [Streptomyces sp. 3330]MDR6980695.1 hypothetical protein [Streptomyces sp. 3330]